jgi:hypothetical protein
MKKKIITHNLPECAKCRYRLYYLSILKHSADWEKRHRPERNKYQREYRQSRKNKLCGVCTMGENQ